MPDDDVSDLRDVVDAINRLCETMKTSDSGSEDVKDDVIEVADVEVTEVELVSPEQIVVNEVETYVAEMWREAAVRIEAAAPARADDVSTVDLEQHRPEEAASVVTPSSYVRVEDEDVRSYPTLAVYGSVDTVVLDSLVSQAENTDIVNLNQSVTQSLDVELAASNQNVVEVEKVETSNQFTAQAVNFELATSIRLVGQGDTHAAASNQPAIPFGSATSATSDTGVARFEPISEYYTASSVVSLLSDTEAPYTAPSLSDLDVACRASEESPEGGCGQVPRDDRNGVMAGHVAAMRERFENMTRANTPCPDLMRSVSPSLDVYRNITPSPDHLG